MNKAIFNVMKNTFSFTLLYYSTIVVNDESNLAMQWARAMGYIW